MTEPKRNPLTEQTGGQPPPPTTDAEEWGDRIEHGRDIARGGKATGHVPGATGDEPSDPRSGQNGSQRS